MMGAGSATGNDAATCTSGGDAGGDELEYEELVRAPIWRVSIGTQSPAIVNATIRDNILFGQPLDQLLYDKCLDICCLVPDLEILPGGDSCEIGEQVRADSNANVLATLVALACCALRAYAACAVRQSE